MRSQVPWLLDFLTFLGDVDVVRRADGSRPAVERREELVLALLEIDRESRAAAAVLELRCAETARMRIAEAARAQRAGAPWWSVPPMESWAQRRSIAWPPL